MRTEFLNSRRKAIVLSLAVLISIATAMPILAQGSDGAGQSAVSGPPRSPFGGTFGPTAGAVNKVLLFCGNCGEGLAGITAYYVGLGATVDQLTTVPADLSPYRLAFVVMPTAAFTSGQITQFKNWVLAGGRLVAVSDYSSFYTGQTVLNGLLTGLGVSMTVDAGPGVDVGCGNLATNIAADSITAGLVNIDYAFTDTITVTAPAKVLIRTLTGAKPMVAVGQPAGAPPRPGFDVVVVGDSNMITDLCPAPANRKIWWGNLYNFAANPTCHNTLNKTTFTTGDNIIVQTLSVTNPRAVALPIEYKLWVDLPGGGTYMWMRGGADDSTVLAAGASLPNALGGPVTLTAVTSTFPARGAYSVNCRLENPVTGADYVVDMTPFTIQ